MHKRGSLSASLYQVVDLIMPAIILVLLLSFVYRSTSGDGFKEGYISKDISLMIDSMDKSPYVTVNYKVNKDVELKITKNTVKAGKITDFFSSKVDIDFNFPVKAGTILTFTKEKNKIVVTSNA